MASTGTEWEELCLSVDLPPGQVLEVSCRGEDLLLYRLADGSCRAVTAYCPHMNNYMPNGLPPGADRSRLLRGDELRCPYHGWGFDPEGRCSLVPPGQRVPPRVRAGLSILRRWEVCERDGRVEIGPEIFPGA